MIQQLYCLGKMCWYSQRFELTNTNDEMIDEEVQLTFSKDDVD